MIRIFASKEELIVSSNVARNVDLMSVALTKIRFISSINEQDLKKSKLKMDLKKPLSRIVISTRNTLLVYTNVKIFGYIDLGEGEKSAERTPRNLQIEVEYSMEFKLPEGEIPQKIKEKGFLIFAKINGPYICWPYIRQIVHSTMAQANIVNVNLPLLTVVEKRPKIDKDKVVEKNN